MGRKAARALQSRQNLVSYLFLAPVLLFFGGFVLLPMLIGIVTSFFNYTMNDFAFAGLANYVEMFADWKFSRSLLNTLIIVAASVPLVTAFALWVGSAISPKRAWVRSFFRGVFYLPVVTGTVPVVVVWKWMFDRYNGIFNWALKSMGVISKNVAWLGDKGTAIWCILLILFTTSIGQPIVLYAAALGNVDKSILEASQVDGASKFQTFWRVTWPSVMPTTLYIVVITTINSFQCFALIQLLTSGGPAYSTSTVMYYLYQNAFTLYRYGYANAMGVILAVVIALFSAVQFGAMRAKGDA